MPKLSKSKKEVNKKTLELFLSLEKQISEMETTNPIGTLKVKMENKEQLEAAIKNLEAALFVIDQQRGLTPSKESLDDNKMKNIVLGIENGSKNGKKIIASANKKEITKKELDAALKQRDQVQKEINDIRKSSQKLEKLYQTQDNLLDDIFNGEYGSVRENQLEDELDQIEMQKSRVMEATLKWQQAAVMLEYACKQLSVAVQKWQQLEDMDNSDERYAIASEARNNMIAAIQNIQGTHRYLENISFPYCTQEELGTLNNAVTYIFTDMQTRERHSHAAECYIVTYKRSCALHQWLDQVISVIIMKELGDINRKSRETSVLLRNERVSLIKEKAREVYGSDIKMPTYESGIASLTDEDVMKLVSQLNENEIFKVDESKDEIGKIILPLTLADMAPLPSKEAIFGKNYNSYKAELEKLSHEYEMQLKEFQKEIEQNQARVNQSLQDKLMARRQRRARMKLEAAEQEAYQVS